MEGLGLSYTLCNFK